MVGQNVCAYLLDQMIHRLKKRKCLEETFHDFIYRLREEFPRVFLSRVKVIAIERFREYATHCWLAINDKPWIIFLIRCRGYLTDI